MGGRGEGEVGVSVDTTSKSGVTSGKSKGAENLPRVGIPPYRVHSRRAISGGGPPAWLPNSTMKSSPKPRQHRTERKHWNRVRVQKARMEAEQKKSRASHCPHPIASVSETSQSLGAPKNQPKPLFNGRGEHTSEIEIGVGQAFNNLLGSVCCSWGLGSVRGRKGGENVKSSLPSKNGDRTRKTVRRHHKRS